MQYKAITKNLSEYYIKTHKTIFNSIITIISFLLPDDVNIKSK